MGLILSFSEKYIVYSGVGDLFVFVTGSGEDDELACIFTIVLCSVFL